MIIQTVDEAIGQTGIKICVYSPAGNGKTVLTATANAYTIILSAEAGLLSLKQAPDHVKCKIGIMIIKTMKDMWDAFNWLSTEKRCEWLMLDSISEIAEVVLGVKMEGVKDPRKAYGDMAADMMALIRALRDIPFYHVMMTAKQTRMKDDYTGITSYVPMLPGKILTNQLAYMFDEMFALQVLPDPTDPTKLVRVLQTGRDVSYEAKDRSGMLDHFEPANLEHIANKILGNPIATVPIVAGVSQELHIEGS